MVIMFVSIGVFEEGEFRSFESFYCLDTEMICDFEKFEFESYTALIYEKYKLIKCP